MMKIYFSNKYGLNQAVLDRWKKKTRREIKLPVVADTDKIVMAEIETDWKCMYKAVFYSYGMEGKEKVCEVISPYQVGDEVAVAQTYSELREELVKRDFKRTDTLYDAFYRAMEFGRVCDTDYGWNNKQGVRADLMPHRIRITDINVERLQEISEEDCLCEGVEKWLDCYIVTGIMEHNGKNNVCFNNPRDAFSVLIDKISGKGTWQRNPWVFVYSFELIQ